MTDQTNPAPEERSEADVEAMIRDYEKKYRVPRLEDLLNDDDLVDTGDDGVEARPTSDDFAVPLAERLEKPKRNQQASQRKTGSMYRRVATTDEERRWATIAHASVLLTLFVGVPTAGFLTLFSLFVPLGIYFAWRQKSEYVAFQALQAFTLQVMGTIGWLVLLTVGVLVGALLLVILAITVVGLILYPVVIPAMILFVVGSFALPLGMLVYSMIAAFQTNQGADYRLPRIGKWIDNQMHAPGFMATEI